jgi:deoxyribodipyrimidine photo-lyase
VHVLVDRPPGDGAYVLYWMIANRRTRTNPALQRAIELCAATGRPLLVFEPLRAGYRWSSPRLHTFVAQGMDDNRATFAEAGVRYVSWLERTPGEGKGLLEALAADAAAVVTDHWPFFFQDRMVAAVAGRLDTRLEAVDGVGVLPLSASERAFTTAASFRRHVQKIVADHLAQPTARTPLDAYAHGMAPDCAAVFARWPGASSVEEVQLALDTPVVADKPGGEAEAQRRLEAFLGALDRYPDRNHPDAHAASGLSPWLHFGHVSGEEIVRRVLEGAGWALGDETDKATGSRGWWNLPEGAEAFLDEILTWRELGHVFAVHRADHEELSSIPAWAQQTLEDHADDPRQLVSFDDLAAANSPDPIWNAAQRELLETGVMHNYLRMLWGKLVLAWAPTPAVAHAWLTELNNRYALDGRDPNSASGIAWVFGRHDRAWGPERPIYGKVRYMTSDSTRRKLRLKDYLARYGA